MEIIDNEQLKLARDFVQQTSVNVFLTGKAGTGKTTFLHNLKNHTDKRMIVVAPTGVAAINAGGVTIHSFFQMPFGPHIPLDPGINPLTARRQGDVRKFSREKINIIRSLDLLVIDEISMVRADLLDGIDEVLRRYRDWNKPFGGVQLLMIGDLYQLAPVLKDDEWQLLRPYYKTGFFFDSHALQKTHFIGIVLQEIFRQSDQHFIELLNKIRENRMDPQVHDELNKRYNPGFIQGNHDGYITLTTHNAQAQSINEKRLRDLPGKVKAFTARISGDFPEHIYPTEQILEIKPGAQVMFVKNDPSYEKRYFNGKIGQLIAIEDDVLYVKCEDEDESIAVEPVTWENQKYSLNEETRAIEERIVGTFTQYPLKLAWAITIHKSQGLTFDKAIIDARDAFAHGQVYVALSRCRSLEGLVLSTSIRAQGVITSREILEFTHDVENNPPDQAVFDKAKHDFQTGLLLDLFDFTKVQWALNRIIKMTNQHAKILMGDVSGKLIKIEDEFRQEISKVGERFKNQIQSIISDRQDIEKHDYLQKRLRDASKYFKVKIDKILMEPVNAIRIESDNQTIRKSIIESLDQLKYSLAYKMACIEACENGFNTKHYLKERGKAAVEAVGSGRSRRTRTAKLEALVENPELYEKLKEWRKRKAQEKNKHENMIMALPTLVAISILVPETPNELRKIPGVGKKTWEYIDEHFMRLLKKYRDENQITGKKSRSVSKPDSKQVSFDMFIKGSSIDEIARTRGLARSTIEGHLTCFVCTGELALEKVVPMQKVTTVIEYFKEVGDYGLNAAREVLGEEYSYGELRMVLAYLRFKGEVEQK